MLKSAENIAVSLVLCCALALLAACSSNKYLGSGETFLEDNAITIKSHERVRNKAVLQTDLENLYLQRKTRVFIGIPRHWFYYQAQKKPMDSTGLRKLLWKIGDEPVILDTSLAEATVHTMEQYLKQHGYWNGIVDYQINTEDHRSRVSYRVDPMRQWTVRSVTYVSDDPVVQQILDTLAHGTLLSPGAPVDVDLFTQEKARMTRQLQNRGYANFFQSYITDPIADSSNYEMDLEIEITTPAESDHHQKYHVGQVIVYPNTNPADPELRDTIVNGIVFRIKDRPQVRPNVIARNIYLNTGSLYTRDDYDKTLKQLGRLETYRFITIRPEANPDDTAALNYRLILVRNKKMGVGGDLEINYSTLANRSLLGLGGNLNYRNRNLFHGAELFTTNLETGIELNLRRTDRSNINSANILVQQGLQIPKFIDPFRFYTLLNKIRIGGQGLLGDRPYRWLTESNSTVNTTYQFVRLVDLYDYHSLAVTLGYDVQPDPNHRLQLTHIGVDLFSPQTQPAFDTILETNTFLRESFNRQLLTGLFFRDYRFSYRGTPKLRKSHFAVFHSAELSGLEVLAVNSLYNAISGKEDGFTIGTKNPLGFSQYAKFEIDTRLYHLLSSTQSLAFRLSIGAGFPYGPYSRQVPYIKQFYVGGPSSIRAWYLRELGPGGYQDPNVDPTLPFYQTGDVKLEFSAEYRFDIFWIFEGAVFLDAGNVWTLKKDDSRPEANFSKNFTRQIAVGSGLGLRMDFTYFLIRLDFGYKLRNPYQNDLGKYWLFDNFKSFSFNQFTTNFAIEYPF